MTNLFSVPFTQGEIARELSKLGANFEAEEKHHKGSTLPTGVRYDSVGKYYSCDRDNNGGFVLEREISYFSPSSFDEPDGKEIVKFAVSSSGELPKFETSHEYRGSKTFLKGLGELFTSTPTYPEDKRESKEFSGSALYYGHEKILHAVLRELRFLQS